MSKPSVTATISAYDLAPPKLRELIATLKQAERVAKEAFGSDGMGKHAAGTDGPALGSSGVSCWELFEAFVLATKPRPRR
ncbi:hypothetical protein CV770_33645 [Bradyrhizobium sp. AC87j1]|uniref:hypothetical protein n=1 Tax=Bradyrhizobium sp. AC87j1 TaxID=2055894 RepID=UPI000CECBCFF|nr:hypothetical protein [Bradyrhizobium sp. AC87j1]PPQ15051.1 hypothetical protein CV770_33645 [Bradyrhizobium sp. AC87j1]